MNRHHFRHFRVGDGTRHRIENTAELRGELLELDRRIRAAKARLAEPILVQPVPGQRPPCSVLKHCRQALL